MLSAVPALLLLAVAIHQRCRVHRAHQSVWKGGGFGMFSDVDRTSVITVLWVRDSKGALERVPLESAAWLAKVSVIPTVRNMCEWGREISRGRWQRCGDFAHELSDLSAVVPLDVAKVTVHHLWMDFNVRTGEYTARQVKECSVKVEAVGD
jgi:hypothetical protein